MSSGEENNVVGTIELTKTTSLVFSVRPWKGRMLAHVRKFVSGPKYTGPTKSGLAMAGDAVVSVIEALARLKSDVPGAQEKQFARIHKGGDIDIVVLNSRDCPSLLVNSGGNRRPWIQFELRGRKNVFAIGARVKIRMGDVTLVKEVSSSGSYAGVNDLRVHFGLGDRETVDQVEVRWPTGKKTVLENVPARKLHRIEEPR